MAIREVPLSEALEKGYRIIDPQVAQRVAPPTWGESLQLMAAEIAPPLALAIVGSLAGPGGSAAAGAAGGGAGNLWAQNLRRDMGLSDEISIGELGASAIAGAIPFTKVAASGMMAKTTLMAAQGAGIAAGETFLREGFQGIERGEGWQLPSKEELATAIAFGGVIGGGLGAVEAKYFSKALDMPVEQGTTRDQLKLMVKERFLLENKEPKQLDDTIQYGTSSETTLYGKDVDRNVAMQHPAYQAETVEATGPYDWARERFKPEQADEAAEAILAEPELFLLEATDNLSIEQLRTGLANQEQVNMTSWMMEANQPKPSVTETIGIKPAQLALLGDVTPPSPGKYIGANLDEYAVADLKASMAGFGEAQTPSIQKFEYAKNALLDLSEKERKGGNPGRIKVLREKRTQHLTNMKQALDEMPQGKGLPEGYTDQYRRILELEDQVGILEHKQRGEYTPEQRKVFAEQARKVREEIYGVEQKLTKEEKHAKDFLTMDKWQQWVASGALSSAPLSMYLDDDDEEGVSTANLAFVASGIMMALLLGKAAGPAMRGFRNLKKDYPNHTAPKLNKKGRIPRKDMPVDFHEAAVNDAVKEGSFKFNKLRDFTESSVSLFSHALQPLSRVAKTINARVARAFQVMESDINIRRRANHREALFMYAMDGAAKRGGWYKKWARAYSYEGAKGHSAIQQLFEANKKEVQAEGRRILKREGDPDAATATVGFGEGAGDYTYARYRKNQDKMFVDLKDEAGYQFGYRKGHNPRMVKSYTQLREYLETNGAVYTPVLDKALKEYADKMGKPVNELTKHEQVQVASRMFSGEIIEGIPGKLQGRKFDEIPVELMDAYEDPGKALSSYINQMTDKIVTRHFLGKFLPSNMGKDASVFDFGYAKLDDTLAGKLAEGMKDEYNIKTPEELKMLQYIIQKRFNPEPSNKFTSLWRSSNYFTTIANIGTTITQLMDLVNTFYFAGTSETFQAMFNRQRNDWFRDLGIDRGNGVDFGATASFLNKVLDANLNLTGFNQLDKWAKNVSLEALYSKFKAKAQKDGTALYQELLPEFGEKQSRQIVEDLKNWAGKIDGVTPTPSAIQHLLFTKASDFLPLSKMEMPGAAEGPWAPMFYQLKNYTIKQMDIYREITRGRLGEARKLVKTGKNAEAAKLAFQATKDLASYGAILAVAGAGTDTIKDLIYGRPFTLEDRVQENIMRLAFINRYHKYKMEREGPGKMLWEMLAPASSFVDRTSKDIMGFVEGEQFRGHALQGTILDGIYWGVQGMGGYEKVRK